MCGIIGLICKNNNLNLINLILKGLEELQNRGYDSSGIGYIKDDIIVTYKFITDHISAIQKLINLNLKENINIAIGHNRWATHGIINELNAHPHTCFNNIFSLIHNGIIENYKELKMFLENQNYKFKSNTDSEIIVNLISYYYIETNKNCLEAINLTINDLKGTYALIILNKEENNKLYFTRKGSPLIVGLNDDMYIITSELSALSINNVNNYFIIENDDIAYIELDNNKLELKSKNKYNLKVYENKILNNKLNYKYWTLKEIFEQPITIQNALNNGSRILNNKIKLGGIDKFKDQLLKINNVLILGCGSSFYVALLIKNFYKKLNYFNYIEAMDGSDFFAEDIPFSGNTMLILISQSGETFDLYRCIEIAKNKNIITVGIINSIDSLIAREVDCGVYCNAGKEVAVAATKTFLSQIICNLLLFAWFAQSLNIHQLYINNLINNIRNLSYIITDELKNLDSSINIIIDKYYNYLNFFVIGKDIDEIIAKEGALKIKELSYIHAEAINSSYLKHGSISLLDEKFPIIIINTLKKYNKNIENIIEEIKSRKSPIILITSNKNFSDEQIDIILIEDNHNLTFISALIAMQLIAYYLAIKRNLNPDMPRNLAKVVTVE